MERPLQARQGFSLGNPTFGGRFFRFATLHRQRPAVQPTLNLLLFLCARAHQLRNVSAAATWKADTLQQPLESGTIAGRGVGKEELQHSKPDEIGFWMAAKKEPLTRERYSRTGARPAATVRLNERRNWLRYSGRRNRANDTQLTRTWKTIPRRSTDIAT